MRVSNFCAGYAHEPTYSQISATCLIARPRNALSLPGQLWLCPWQNYTSVPYPHPLPSPDQVSTCRHALTGNKHPCLSMELCFHMRLQYTMVQPQNNDAALERMHASSQLQHRDCLTFHALLHAVAHKGLRCLLQHGSSLCSGVQAILPKYSSIQIDDSRQHFLLFSRPCPTFASKCPPPPWGGETYWLQSVYEHLLRMPILIVLTLSCCLQNLCRSRREQCCALRCCQLHTVCQDPGGGDLWQCAWTLWCHHRDHCLWTSQLQAIMMCWSSEPFEFHSLAGHGCAQLMAVIPVAYNHSSRTAWVSMC